MEENPYVDYFAYSVSIWGAVAKGAFGRSKCVITNQFGLVPVNSLPTYNAKKIKIH